MEFLLWSTGRAVLDLVHFADQKAEQGVMKKKRLIVPSMKRIRKWFLCALSIEDSSVDHTPDTTETMGVSIEIGDAYQRRKDPEHLPPTNAWQRFGNGVRKVSGFLGSQESAFGFRVACATLSIGIVAYLESTQAFFIQQRLVWAMIMVAIGMTITAGAGVFGFIGRVAGTSKMVQCSSPYLNLPMRSFADHLQLSLCARAISSGTSWMGRHLELSFSCSCSHSSNSISF